MTKRLSKEAKEQRKADRRKSKQQKSPSKTVKTITQPNPADQAAPPVNLCDDCAYEFGECEGKPKFASDKDETLTGAEADRVIECPAFVNVAAMPTADQASNEAAAQSPAAAEEKPEEHRRECDVEHLRDYPGCSEVCDKDECDGVPTDAAYVGGDEGSAESDEESVELEDQVIPTDLPERPDPQRFKAEEDFEKCPSCDRPLKRTAFNRYQDAIRCTWPRCRAYRALIKTVSTGIK